MGRGETTAVWPWFDVRVVAPTDLDVALAAARAGRVVLDDMYGSALAVEHKAAKRLAYVTDFDGAPAHTGRGVVAARDATTHATLLRLVGKHRAS